MQTPTNNNNGYKPNATNVTDSNDKSYIVCNIYNKKMEDTQKTKTDYIETTETLKDNYIPSNQFPKKSVMQKPTNDLYMDNDRSNPYPLLDNTRAQINSKDKNIKPLNLNPYYNNIGDNLRDIPPQDNNLAQKNINLDPNQIVIQNQEETKTKKEEGIKKNKGCEICLIIVLVIICPLLLICFIPMLIYNARKNKKKN